MDEKRDQAELPKGQIANSSTTLIKPQSRKPHDPSVTFEEYHYYALRTREEEQTLQVPKTNWKEIVLRKKKTNISIDDNSALQTTQDHETSQLSHLQISDEEWTNASRAFRTASWGACE
jgi:hypothetical protein